MRAASFEIEEQVITDEKLRSRSSGFQNAGIQADKAETTERVTTKKKKFIDRFKQQELGGWQPAVTSRFVILFFLICGVVFIIIGSILLSISNSTIECSIEYGDPPDTSKTHITTVQITAESCNPSKISGKPIDFINGELYLYYSLTNFYQNHRRYLTSRSNLQLSGEVFTKPSELSSCEPLITDKNGSILSPCGLVAWSVFNDTYTVVDGNGELIQLDESTETITLLIDRESKFKNPSSSEVEGKNINQWLPEDIFPGKVENGHFIVWMRTAALPSFKKIYAKFVTSKPVKLPLTVHISNRYPVKGFEGTKGIVVSQITWTGGKNPFIGIVYIVIGSICCLLAMIFMIRNYISPRILGDIRYLYWVRSNK
ncbi:LEM3 CDC50 family protein [Cryptosporidium andersoni]|uniref:LEM3 CDC50 family protein n=1 Tax=Cryptosporidium andersoni TaxID=117008 RepID=A0A1J4MQG3_9CRYT|nr:LEM3 CDC50 family protein [Cryptosporidium andersoni]